MCYQELVDYTAWGRKRKGPAMYLGANSAIDDAEPLHIMVLFILLLP
jgi:hypothetical protein